MRKLINVKKDGAIALVRLSRPKAFNSFNLEMVSSLASQLVELSADDSMRGVLITGEGRAFCAGCLVPWPAGRLTRVESGAGCYNFVANVTSGGLGPMIATRRARSGP